MDKEFKLQAYYDLAKLIAKITGKGKISPDFKKDLQLFKRQTKKYGAIRINKVTQKTRTAIKYRWEFIRRNKDYIALYEKFKKRPSIIYDENYECKLIGVFGILPPPFDYRLSFEQLIKKHADIETRSEFINNHFVITSSIMPKYSVISKKYGNDTVKLPMLTLAIDLRDTPQTLQAAFKNIIDYYKENFKETDIYKERKIWPRVFNDYLRVYDKVTKKIKTIAQISRIKRYSGWGGDDADKQKKLSRYYKKCKFFIEVGYSHLK